MKTTPIGPTSTLAEMEGDETDADCKQIAWEMFCNAHPVEAHHHDPDGFWNHFRERAPGVTREQMVAMLKE